MSAHYQTSSHCQGQGNSESHGAQRRPQRKKRQASLNHMFNFSLPERETVTESTGPRASNDSAGYKPYKKEDYLNANFRFLLNASGDYTQHLSDPDLSFDWKWIEQVLLYGVSSCPICLESPVAARIARCGHVFCLACILHCLQEHKACPICWDCILGPCDLKPVKVLASKTYEAGDMVELCLVHRRADSMFAMPVTSSTSNNSNNHSPIPWNTAPLAMQFSRFMLAKPEYMEAEYEKDATCLGQAINNIDEDGELAALLAGLDVVHRHKERHQQPVPSSAKQHNNHRPHHPDNGATATDYHFYQEANGQFIFVHPRDIRILRHEFGDYVHFPSRIQPMIRELEEMVLTEDHRRRLKYLGHLPVGCTITLISVDLSGIVSKETMDAFADHPNHPAASEQRQETIHEPATAAPETDTATIHELIAEEEWSDEDEMLQHVLRISALQYHKENGREVSSSANLHPDQLKQDKAEEPEDHHDYYDLEWEEYVESSRPSVRPRR